jgi:signal transduction histidine kinase
MTGQTPDDAGLLRLVGAYDSIVSDLDLSTVLRRVVEVAVDLVGARYGALGVIAPGGSGLEEFVHVGASDEAVARIGHLPEGKGILGALIDDPRPIRLDHLAADPRSVGFPAGHPPMDSFLGVPVRVRGEVFGNLYLTEALAGSFDAEGEAIAVSLAGTAGIAIHNARMYADSRQRQQWLLASTDVTRRALGEPATATPALVADTALALAGADLVVVAEVAGADAVRVTAASGAGAAALVDAVVTTSGPVRRTLGTSDARVVDSLEIDGLPGIPRGPALILPLHGVPANALVAVRAAEAHPFTGHELEMASTFATQVAMALELARARADQQRMVLLEDRTRIARDLHDHVIQQVFAAGMSIQGIATTIDDPDRARALSAVVDTLDEAVKRVRTSIFHLRTGRDTGPGLRGLVLDVVADLSDGLGFEPHVTFDGPVDAVGGGPLAEDVVAVVREALTNVARHAAASTAAVRLHADAAHLTVEVEDDGCGGSAATRRSGLANLGERARRRGGDIDLGPGHDGVGTRLRWSVPVA